MMEKEEFEVFLELVHIAPNKDAHIKIKERGKRALAFYNATLGVNETNLNVAFHHAVQYYGPPCERCGKVLRSPTARRCLLCGLDRAPGPWIEERRVPL